MNVVIYARVSSTDGSQTTENQTRELEQWEQFHNLARGHGAHGGKTPVPRSSAGGLTGKAPMIAFVDEKSFSREPRASAGGEASSTAYCPRSAEARG